MAGLTKPNQSMRAWTYTRRGSPLSVLTLNDIPIPEVIPDHHLLVKITHTALNPSIALIMNIIPNPLFQLRVPEVDFAGVVVKSGAKTHLQPGTRVFGGVDPHPKSLFPPVTPQGSLAEYVVVHENSAMPIPENVSNETASGLTAAGSTAINFITQSGIRAGSRVLINGASGGVGTILVQLARLEVGPQGHVAAICSEKNVEFVKTLGADEVIPYNGSIKPEIILAEKYASDPFDSIIDTIGVQSIYKACPSFLKENSAYLNMGAINYVNQGAYGFFTIASDLFQNVVLPSWMGGTPRTYKLLTSPLDQKMLKRLSDVVASGEVKCIIDSIYSMEDVLKAYEKLLSNRARGKVIIQVQKE